MLVHGREGKPEPPLPLSGFNIALTHIIDYAGNLPLEKEALKRQRGWPNLGYFIVTGRPGPREAELKEFALGVNFPRDWDFRRDLYALMNVHLKKHGLTGLSLERKG